MIVFAAFTPHTPLLIPSIGKDRLQALADTDAAMTTLAEELYLSHPDTIVIIASHKAMYEDAFAGNLHTQYVADLSSYGDLGKHRSFRPHLGFIDTMQRHLRRSHVPFTLHSVSELDHGCAVPLLRLTERLPNIRIVPLTYAEPLTAKEHVAFGKQLSEVFAKSSDRIAVIASGDLSHALSKDAPAGLRPEGKQFDTLVCNAVQQGSLSSLMQADEAMVAAASECALRPLLVLLGILDRMHVEPEILAYEHPFGVGYLTARFHLS